MERKRISCPRKQVLIVRSMLDLLFSIHCEIINVLKKELYALVIIENFRESF